MKRRDALLACAAAALLAPRARAQDEALLRELRAGAVLLMRHTQTTPGVGDPPGWKLGDCTSQRNLDASGIAHAERIGRWFAQHKLSVGSVRNSPWCRARDTARLAFGRSDDWAALANIFEDRSGADAQAAAVRKAIDSVKPGELVVWVAHGSTIAHIVGGSAAGLATGEAVLVRRAAQAGAPPLVLGRLLVP